jgi:hypothetical protein
MSLMPSDVMCLSFTDGILSPTLIIAFPLLLRS